MADLPISDVSLRVGLTGVDSSNGETTPVNSSLDGSLFTEDILRVGGLEANIVVGLTSVEAKVGASRAANRKVLTVTPITGILYWGFNSTVTISTGTPIFKNQEATFKASCPIYLISPTANNNVRVSEGW